MPNKCSVPGCNTNFQFGPNKPVFKFPQDPVLSGKWLQFLNRKDYEVSHYSVICIDHFEDKYLIKNDLRTRLDSSMCPIPTIHPNSIPLSQATVPSKARKLPKSRVVAPDELEDFKSKCDVKSFDNLVQFIRKAEEYIGFQFDLSDTSITAYRAQICSGIAKVKEYIHIDNNFHVKLSYESCPIPLPIFIQIAEGCAVTSLDMLTNLPAYCRNAKSTSVTLSFSNEQTAIIEDFLNKITEEDFDQVDISQDTADVIIYVAGYISHSLIKHIDCTLCTISLNNDPISSAYLDESNKGGLKYPTSSLSNYVLSAFSVLEFLEKRIIVELDIPSKVVAQHVLDHLSSEWDHSFVCSNHSSIGCHKVNSIVSNCFLKNLARDVTDKRRKDEVKEFKRIKRQINNDN